MKVLDLIALIIPAFKGLDDKLKGLLTSFPDLAAVLNPLISGLESNVTTEQLITALSQIEPEAAQFLRDFKLSPRQHPSDLA
jgi:hypothetical protein